jgi:hypothetical protein
VGVEEEEEEGVRVAVGAFTLDDDPSLLLDLPDELELHE